MAGNVPKRPRNLLALAVLACLAERPMHPYEIATTLRQRAKHQSVKLNYGSLYGVVDALARDGLIEPVETSRDGRRPERTTYRLLEAGWILFEDWLSDLLAFPEKEFTQLEAGLSFMPGLPPERVATLLGERVRALEIEIATLTGAVDAAVGSGLPELFVVEVRFRLAMRRAEAEFCRELAASIAGGEMAGVEMWSAIYAELTAARKEGRLPDLPDLTF
jgi:DNA-binding PadR family transcriptional regulator